MHRPLAARSRARGRALEGDMRLGVMPGERPGVMRPGVMAPSMS